MYRSALYYLYFALHVPLFPGNIHLFKVNDKKKNNRKRCKICSKLTITVSERQRRSSVFVADVEYTLHLSLAFLLLTLSMNK